MALILYPPPSHLSASSSFTTVKLHLFLRTPPHPKLGGLRIRLQQDSSAEETPSSPSTKKPANSSPGSGFGASAAASAAAPAKKKQSKGKRERASIIRREPEEKPSFIAAQDAARAEELRKNESAFVLAWLGLGAIILVEGILLAASGFLPEAWDNFFVKYLYPSFTPTVFLFIAGTTAYGVLKYLQNESSKSES